MREHLSGYWWECKDHDIKTYVNSCETCAKRKGNYGKRKVWPTGHCKRGERPFEIIYIDFVTMPISKGKRYILTMLDSFSRHLTAVPCSRDRAIDAARGIYSFFLRHREIPRIVSSDRGTHFTGEVYRIFCQLTSITQELHCAWRPQSSGNIERQHRTMKNAIYMLCEDRDCEWTDVLESVISSMNATINSATGASPHYIITGRQPNIGLPRLPDNSITNPSPTAYGMQVNALLRQVHRHVALANNEADHAQDPNLDKDMNKEPIQVGDKVLIHRPQSAIAHASHLPWIGTFEVAKTNSMVIQIKNDDGQSEWVHRAHVRRLIPRPKHLSPNLPPLPYPTRQSTEETTLPPKAGAHRALQDPIYVETPRLPSGYRSDLIRNRSTRGQLPKRFKDFIMG